MLTITGGEIIEGNSGFDNFVVFTATLSEALLEPVSFRYAARSGTADEEADFDSAGTIVTIPAGQTSAQFSVRTVADNFSESDESVKVDIFNVQGTTLANAELRTTVQGVILDDDGTGLKRSVLVNDAFLVEEDTGTKQAVFEIRLSQPSTEAITLNYETRDGTAFAGSDYTAATGTVTIPAGQTVATVAVDVNGDTTLEGTEQFSLVVSPTAADADELAVDFAGGVATILGDDASGSAPSLSVSGADVLEGNSGFDNFITYTVTLSEPALSSVSFSYRARSGTADEDVDFDSVGTTLAIAAGQTTAQFTVRTVADNAVEADESVQVDIFNVQGAVLANGEPIATVQSVILDDDGSGQKRVAFVNDVLLVEGDGGTKQAVFEVRLSEPASEAITLTYETRDGTAVAGSDYTAATGTVTFAAGQTLASVAVDVLGDTIIEGSEKFSLVVAPVAADADQLAVDFAGGVATILDDDASSTAPSLTVTGGEAVEGNSGFDNFIVYTVTLSEPALSPVSFSYRAISGAADEDADFDSAGTTVTIAAGQTSAQFLIRTVADNGAEADQNVQVDIFNVQGAELANGEERMIVQSVLLDDDGSGVKRAVTVQDTVISEGDSGTKQAVFEIQLSNPSEEEIVFNYTTVEGTATSNGDFQGTSGQVTFAAGQTVAAVAVDVSGDTASEQMESFQLVLTSSSSEIEGGQTGVAATATLLDDDTALGLAPEISLTAGEAIEGNSGFDNFLRFTVTLSEPSTSPVSFNFEALSGTAVVSTDFDVTASTLTIPAGRTTGEIFVRTVADNTPEENETVVLELSNPTGAVFAGGGATLSATGTILDDDAPAPVLGTPRVTVEDTSAQEGNAMTFTLTRIGSTAEETTGSFELLDGTADAGSDFAGASGQFTFAVGALTTTISVPIINDTLSEGAETLVLQLSDLENGVFPGVARDAYAIGTIGANATPPPGPNIILGSEAGETINGTEFDDQIFGFGDDDRILGLDGDDSIFGGDGLDVLNGGAGNDVLDGGAGDDRIFAEAGDDTLIGGDGNDLLEGKIGNDTILGDAGNDILRGSDGNDVIKGGDGDDTAFGGNDNDVLRGGEGNDTLDGSGGNDTVYGDAGDDTLVGGTGFDVLKGGTGEDTLRGGGGDDTLFGEADNDLMFGAAGEDLMFGGAGDDTMEGNAQADKLFGEAGNDILRGGDGFDFLSGGTGNDILAGGNGQDELIGGAGIDTLRGQGNADTFIFNTVSDSAFGASDLIDGVDGIGSAAGDLINLSAIDADTTLGGDQSFTFLGELTTAQGLAAGAGALWVENVGNQTRVYGTVDDDGTIDFALRVIDGAGTTASNWVADDFLL